jgi:hypothetical protein
VMSISEFVGTSIRDTLSATIFVMPVSEAYIF